MIFRQRTRRGKALRNTRQESRQHLVKRVSRISRVEELEDRLLLAATPRLAIVISGFGGADYPDRVVEELVASGYEGVGDGVLSNWNSLSRAGDPGGFEASISAATTSVGIDGFSVNIGGQDFGVPDISVDIPTGIKLGLVDLGDPDSSQQIVNDVAAILADPIYDNPDSQIVLIGHSLGGDTALKIAQETSREIDLLALLDPVGFSGAVSNAAMTIATPSISIPGFGSIATDSIPIEIPSNSDNQTPGFFLSTNLSNSEVPSNVDYFYNRWQTNDLFPIDFLVPDRSIDCAATTCDQGVQDTKPDRYNPLTSGDPLDLLAFLAPDRLDLNPFGTREVTVLGITGNVPTVNDDFLTSNAQLHHDFPDNPRVQSELITILNSIDPRKQPDRFETNDTLPTATPVPAAGSFAVNDLTIHSTTDIDVFQSDSNDSGLLLAEIQYCHDDGPLILEALDGTGSVISTGTVSGTSTNTTQSITLAVSEGESVFIRTRGANGAVNVYDLAITTLKAEPPNYVNLLSQSDTGVSQSDNYTADRTPSTIIQSDLREFADANLILGPFDTGSGVSVVQLVSDAITGDVVDQRVADRVGGISSYLFDVTSGSLDDGEYIASAFVRLFDGTGDFVDSKLSPPTKFIVDRTEPLQANAPDLLAVSDSGMFDDDNVTKVQAVAIAGSEVEPNVKVRVFADDQLVGQGVSTTSGKYEITTEPLTDGVYDITVELEDLAGNISDRSETLTIEIDTIEPNTAYLDLVDASDSGRHNDDNVTNDNTPDVTMTTHDANVALHEVLFTDYLKFRIYDRFEESDEVLIYDSSTVTAVDDISTPGDGFTSLTLVTTTLAQLNDGVHNLKLEVEDRAGNISHDFLLDLVIDTEAYLGDVNLHPDSDSGVSPLDRITSDTVPDFYGVAEANNIVTIAINGIPAGTTVSVPLDGDDAFQPPNAPYDNVEGNYRVETNLSLLDGQNSVTATFEDLAGNRVSTEELLIFVDTEGPRVFDVEVNVPGNPYDLFDPKPSVDGPTPAVHALVISVSDNPSRSQEFDYGPIQPLLAINAGHYQLVGDHSGIIAIESIEYDVTGTGPGPASGTITLNFSSPLPDDRFTLTVSDQLADAAGNALDGESNASEPQDDVNLPSGNGIPGGDFVARFTVDSRPELATWSQAVVYADINGNFVWDPEGQDNDATNRDFVFNFGEITDAYFTGNFAPNALPGADGMVGTPDDIPISPDDATSSGFDKVGAYGAFGGQYQFFLDTDDDGVGDLVGSMAFQVNAIPVAGNFFHSTADDNAVANGERPRDEIGAFDGQFFYLDVNGDNQIDDDERFNTNLRGNPLVGDFNGDGVDDLAAYNNDTGVITFNLISSYSAAGPVVAATDQFTFGFSGFGDIPVAGDMNLDGIDDIAMWVPGREGQLPKDSGEFHILVSDNVPNDPMPGSLPSDIFGPYSPAPLGNDLIAAFGDDFALPLLGNFDPPVVPEGGFPDLGSLTNELNPLDTTRDGQVTARDALVIINALSRDIDVTANKLRLVASLGGFQLDASEDGQITALDALRVINGLGQQAEAEMTDQTAWAVAADNAINQLREDDDDLIDLLAFDAEQNRVKA